MERNNDMNKVALIGRLTDDPKITNTEKGLCIASYTLAVQRKYKKDGESGADFIMCKAFGKNGEFAEKYLTKGIKIAICGHIQTGSYTNKDGNRVFTTEVIVDEAEFCESKNANKEAQNMESSPAQQSGLQGDVSVSTPATQVDDTGFMNIPDMLDDNLPFA